jgi:hypothetical protein
MRDDGPAAVVAKVAEASNETVSHEGDSYLVYLKDQNTGTLIRSRELPAESDRHTAKRETRGGLHTRHDWSETLVIPERFSGHAGQWTSATLPSYTIHLD